MAVKKDYNEILKSLKNKNILKKDWDKNIEIINQRVCDIWYYIHEKCQAELIWWSFDCFDPKKDYKFIFLESETKGDLKCFKNGFSTYIVGLSDYKSEINKLILEYDKKVSKTKADNDSKNKTENISIEISKEKIIKIINILNNSKKNNKLESLSEKKLIEKFKATVESKLLKDIKI